MFELIVIQIFLEKKKKGVAIENKIGFQLKGQILVKAITLLLKN